MQGKFSTQLIKKCQEIFSKRSGITISPEQAERYLEKLAQLGLAMTKGGETHGQNK